MADEEMTDYLSGVVGVVEANSYEMLCLFNEYTNELKKPWKQNSFGLGENVGEFGGMPVFVSLLTAEVDGHKILFIDPTSQVVDHRMVEKWLAETLPASAKLDSGRVNKTDAMNFHNVFPRKRAAA
jgi:hypothetical protein